MYLFAYIYVYVYIYIHTHTHRIPLKRLVLDLTPGTCRTK